MTLVNSNQLSSGVFTIILEKIYHNLLQMYQETDLLDSEEFTSEYHKN